MGNQAVHSRRPATSLQVRIRTVGGADAVHPIALPPEELDWRDLESNGWSQMSMRFSPESLESQEGAVLIGRVTTRPLAG